MSDDPSKTGKPDRTRINISQTHEVQYWSKKFNVPPDALVQAARRVGPSVKDVQAELARQGLLGGGDGVFYP